MQPDYAPMTDLPAPRSTRLIDFEDVAIRTLRSFPPQHVLVVSGTKPFSDMEVTLEPLVFVRQPEYWGIEVVGRLPGGVGLPAVVPYQVSIPLARITGTKGIEVIGASRTERRDVPHLVAEVTELRFSRDDRPVDGELREIDIDPDGDGTFTATLHTAHVDRASGQSVERTDELAAGLTCTITADRVSCSRDDRPADGALKELTVERNAEGTFDAELRTASFDRMNGGEVDETTEIGSGLART